MNYAVLTCVRTYVISVFEEHEAANVDIWYAPNIGGIW